MGSRSKDGFHTEVICLWKPREVRSAMHPAACMITSVTSCDEGRRTHARCHPIGCAPTPRVI